jgi:chromosome segregation ATPase
MDNLEWLHKHMRKQRSGSPQKSPADITSIFPSAGDGVASRDGQGALDLVYQAAEVVRSIEDRANEFETHVRDVAEKAVEKLKLAERRIQELELQQREAEACIIEVRAKLQQAGEALQEERARVLAAENQLPELELRARLAEARAEEYQKTLARIEDTIRTEILRQRPSVSNRSNAAA